MSIIILSEEIMAESKFCRFAQNRRIKFPPILRTKIQTTKLNSQKCIFLVTDHYFSLKLKILFLLLFFAIEI